MWRGFLKKKFFGFRLMREIIYTTVQNGKTCPGTHLYVLPRPEKLAPHATSMISYSTLLPVKHFNTILPAGELKFTARVHTFEYFEYLFFAPK